MGVQNLWQLLESTGRPVNMSKGLEGKVLAIDISIWLHQAAKAMRDRQNPHILVLLHRICKLLHFKIKPIFIFDGGVPELKRRTLAERRERRELAASKAKEANNKVRQNYLKMLAIQQLKGETIQSLPPPAQDDENERDLFELPENHLRAQLAADDDEKEGELDDEEFIENADFEPIRKSAHAPRRTHWSKTTTTDASNHHYSLPDVNKIDDDALDNLPVEMQHDILSEMKESLKRGRHQTNKMPQKSDDFSNYQVQKLLKQNTISKKIATLNKTIKRQKFDIPVDSDVRVYAGKLASDSNTQYILIKSSQNSTPANPTQTSNTSTPSPAFTRHNTSDYSADDLMSRDPVAGLSQKPITKAAVEPKPLPTTPIRPPVTTVQLGSESEESDKEEEKEDEEKRDLALAIQRSLEDQQQAEVEETNSDSDDDDMIEVPIVVPSREPILPPEFPLDETPSQANTSAETVESIEEEKDESSNNSSAVEDIQPYLNEPEIQSLERMQTEIITDTAEQMAKARGHERMTTTLNDTMHEDTQYLLRLFGIPFVVSPTEAEAQCSYLDLTNQCDGVISDDSDVWLFGAKRVYRHFFRQNQLVEYYDATVIENQLGLDRESMIAIGMIVGSDYTKGIANAGLMTALEVLQEFHGTCIERLEKFRRWWKKAQNSNYKTDSKVLKRLKNLQLFEGFPNQAVHEAYIHPKIDEDQSKFTWAMPQLDLIREFIGSKLKWDRQRIDDMILPVIKRMNTKEIQSRIDAFFAPLPFQGTGNQIKRNTRLKAALDLLKERSREAKDLDEQPLGLSDEDDDDVIVQPEKVVSTKRKRQKATKLMDEVVSAAEKTRTTSK